MLPAGNPRDRDASSLAEVERGRVDRQFLNCRPKFQVVSETTALEALVAILRQIDRESRALTRPGAVYWTRATQLVARSAGWQKPNQIQDLLHGTR